MSMGNTIGFSTWLSENCPVGNLYNELNYDVPIVQGVHMDLMGDPTLRMEYDHPPSDFLSLTAQSTLGGHAVLLDWKIATPADGYNVYRAHHWNDTYSKLNAMPTPSLTLTDSMPFTDSNYYVVRAVSKSGGTHGTYYSVGSASNPVVATGLADVASSSASNRSIRIAIDGPIYTIFINYDTDIPSRLAIYDISGREIDLIDPALRGRGEHEYTLDMRSSNEFRSGIYFVRLIAPANPVTAKFSVAR
jgi:hypothetical protein